MSSDRPKRTALWVVLGVFGLLAVAFVLLISGQLYPLEFGIKLLFGWIWFILRTVPEIEWNPGAILTGIVAGVALCTGAHVFLGRLLGRPGAREGSGREWRLKWTLSGVGLLLLFFMVAIASAGIVHQVGWLLTSPEPLTRSSWPVIRSAEDLGGESVIGAGADPTEPAETPDLTPP